VNSSVNASWRSPGKLRLVLFGLLLGAAMAEGALRLVRHSYPELYQADALRGFALRPGVQGWYHIEGESYVRINSDGLRDREHSKAKPADTIRIAIIGDSYAEALQVDAQDAFWSVLERALQGCGALSGKKVEAINFGVSGYGTGEELLTLRERAWQYSPDIVLLAFTTNNDVSDNSRVLKKTNRVPYFVYRDGALTLDDSFRESSTFRWQQSLPVRIGTWIRDHSRLVQSLMEGYRGFRIWRQTKAAVNKRNSAPPAVGAPVAASAAVAAGEELGVDETVYRQPDDAVWTDAWRVTEGLLTTMQEEVKAHGAKFLVVTLSNGIQVHPEAQVRQAFMDRVGVSTLFYPDDRVAELGAHAGFTVLQLAPRMQAYAEQNHAFLHGFGANTGSGHWNQLGHQVAGNLLAQDVCGGLLK